jgi:hypothetical protein
MPRKVAASPRSPSWLSLLGLGQKTDLSCRFDLVDVDVLTEAPDASQPNNLLVTVRMHRPDVRSIEEVTGWLEWCQRVQLDFAAYLMARKVG